MNADFPVYNICVCLEITESRPNLGGCDKKVTIHSFFFTIFYKDFILKSLPSRGALGTLWGSFIE